MPQKKKGAKKSARKSPKKSPKKTLKKTAQKKAIKKKATKKKAVKKMTSTPNPVPAGWCQDFNAPPGAPIVFTAPADGTINQSGGYWPFCGQNDTKLGPPIDFSTLNQQIYIKSTATPGSICPFTPAPCFQAETRSVTIT